MNGTFQFSEVRILYTSDYCIGGDINDTERETFARFGLTHATESDDYDKATALNGLPQRVQATMLALGVTFNQACYEIANRLARVTLTPQQEIQCMRRLFAAPEYIADHNNEEAIAAEYIHTAPTGCDHVCAYADTYTGQIA